MVFRMFLLVRPRSSSIVINRSSWLFSVSCTYSNNSSPSNGTTILGYNPDYSCHHRNRRTSGKPRFLSFSTIASCDDSPMNIASSSSTSSSSSIVNKQPSELVFLGTGSSSGVPYIYNLMLSPDDETLHPLDRRGVEISRKATEGDPRNNRNYRCNPSILIRYRPTNDSQHVNILFDAGKTFRESAVRWFPYHNIQSIDSVVLTHGHADSIFGIDDLRSTQPRTQKTPLPVFQSKECQLVTRQVFSYLYPAANETPEANSNEEKEPKFINQWDTADSPKTVVVKRFVANIDWKDIVPYEAFVASGMAIFPIPVMHGEDMTCMGFVLGRDQKICYLSDISRMLPKSLEFIQSMGTLDLLIVDTIRMGKNMLKGAGTHFTSDEAVELCRVLRPKRALLIGMASVVDHEAANQELATLRASEGLDIQLSYDGMKIDLWL